MMKRAGFLQRFLREECAASAIEFAIVAPVFFLLLLGIVEFGLIMFSSVAIESIVMEASREASLGLKNNNSDCKTTTTTVEFVNCYVHSRVGALINSAAISVIAVPYSQSGAPPVVHPPDVCISATGFGGTLPSSDVGGGAGNSGCPGVCTQYMETNGDNAYECDQNSYVTGSDTGNGGDNADLVQMNVYYPWKVQIPFLAQYFGCHGQQGNGCQQGVIMITSSTVVKNEPF